MKEEHDHHQHLLSERLHTIYYINWVLQDQVFLKSMNEMRLGQIINTDNFSTAPSLNI